MDDVSLMSGGKGHVRQRVCQPMREPIGGWEHTVLLQYCVTPGCSVTHSHICAGELCCRTPCKQVWFTTKAPVGSCSGTPCFGDLEQPPGQGRRGYCGSSGIDGGVNSGHQQPCCRQATGAGTHLEGCDAAVAAADGQPSDEGAWGRAQGNEQILKHTHGESRRGGRAVAVR